ncbi:MAG: aminotransferase class I/II-fold pyridoxal phosphate-dependent enzyme [Acidobacteriota bacterium]|jgi:methionine-gamma-lyase
MSHDDHKNYHDDTRCIHAGQDPSKQLGAVTMPIYQTSTFAFESPEQGAARFKGTEDGYIYTRLGNPTVHAFEQNVAALEEGEDALATATGMAAVSTLYFALLSAGDHIVCSQALYGPSRLVLEKDFSRFNVKSSFVDTSNLDAVKASWRPETKILYIETPTNPTLAVTDIQACAEIAHEHGALLIVDNTFMSPILQKPFRFGADIVLHSITKFINGHADVVGGVLVFRDKHLYVRVKKALHFLGGTMDPHQSWLVLRGVKTLGMRVRTAQDNARAIAELLASHPAVGEVRYPGLPGHPKADLIERQMEGPGALIAFELKGGIDAGKRLMGKLKIAALAVSLGGVESLIQHPASMTHAGMSPEDRLEAGITDGLVRLSVGCEDKEDLLADMKQGLDSLL